MTNQEVVEIWKTKILANDALQQNHDFYSLWTGLVIGLGRSDLAPFQLYKTLGFPEELKIGLI